MKDETKEELCINGGALLCVLGLAMVHIGLAIAVVGIVLIIGGLFDQIERERND